MTDDDLQPLVAAEYLALADLLDDLPETAWDSPSMCEGWRVREVVAHMTMPARYTEDAFTAELRACDFDFTRLSNLVASRDADLPTTQLADAMRTDVMHNWAPGASHGNALNHVVIHGLDMTVPLGRARRSPDSTIRIVLDDLTQRGVHSYFGVDIDGRTLEATDIGWSYGSGPLLRGSAADLTLLLCGRAIPADRLDGEPLVTRAATSG